METRPQKIPFALMQLMDQSKVVVKQKINEGLFSGYIFEVMTPDSTLLFTAKELGMVWMSAYKRRFTFTVRDQQNTEIINLERPVRCGQTVMSVKVLGILVSMVWEKPTLIDTVLYINDAEDRPQMRIKGSKIDGDGGTVYELQTLDKHCIGHVKKVYQGFWRALLSNRNTYEIEFPLDLDVLYKAVVIASCILIDFLTPK